MSDLYDKIGRRFVPMTPHYRLYVELQTGCSWEHPYVNILSLQSLAFLLCTRAVGQDPDWLALNAEFTIDVVKGAAIINLFPNFMKPWATHNLIGISRFLLMFHKFGGPSVDQR